MCKDMNIDASVIMPVFNQAESLQITLKFFELQTYPFEKFEIIVIDDGSTDNLKQKINDSSWPRLQCATKYLHIKNQGRAVARNTGVKLARGKILIFCDSDRFPQKDFIKNHVEQILKNDSYVVIGCPWEYFGKVKELSDIEEDNWIRIKKYSRSPMYYQKISKIYSSTGITDSGIAWATFLVGNSSMKRSDFVNIGGFDVEFKKWGFEHFELAFRLQRNGMKFLNCPNIANYHIPHSREKGFYQCMIKNSISILKNKYPEYDFELLKNFIFGDISLQEFELGFNNCLSNETKKQEPIYHKMVQHFK